jgi:sterol desaturase/sphingolipid hydroxylase (fatty acid hydroxylase superfamily)
MELPQILAMPRVHEIAAPLYLAFLALEYVLVSRGRAKGRFERADVHTSLTMGVGSIVSALVFGGLGLTLVLSVYENRLATIGFEWWAFLICFVLDDLRFYWGHRIQHRSRWFWAAHVVHHSSRHYNFSTALRQPWTGALTGLIVLAVPLAWRGFHPAWIGFCASLNLFYQFFLHTETVGKLPWWIEAVFNTPSHHRVHHARNARYLDANYAGTLIVWDRLFGTFVPELERDAPEFGLVKNIDTFNPIAVALGEYGAIARDVFQRRAGLADRVRYVFAPPGWCHDDSRMSSRQIKAEFLRAHPAEAGTPGLSV